MCPGCFLGLKNSSKVRERNAPVVLWECIKKINRKIHRQVWKFSKKDSPEKDASVVVGETTEEV